jgi:hypothetical protein
MPLLIKRNAPLDEKERPSWEKGKYLFGKKVASFWVKGRLLF